MSVGEIRTESNAARDGRAESGGACANGIENLRPKFTGLGSEYHLVLQTRDGVQGAFFPFPLQIFSGVWIMVVLLG
jgi:hypothetical protein